MNKQDDEQWLAALAGRPDPSADPATNAQAHALRSAMLARREQLERDAQHANAGEFERLRTRLTHEGLLQEKVTPEHNLKNTGFMAWVATWFPAEAKGSFALPAWSLAANLVLAIVVVFQLVTPDASKPNEADVLRSGQATVLRVSDPESRLAELTHGLNEINTRYVVKRDLDGTFELIIQFNKKALDYLIEQRIETPVVDDVFIVRLEKIKQ